jgi:hypothetical protein
VTVSISSIGVERKVCEACGHVGVQFMTDLSSEVDRTRFARPGDRDPARRRRKIAD